MYFQSWTHTFSDVTPLGGETEHKYTHTHTQIGEQTEWRRHMPPWPHNPNAPVHYIAKRPISLLSRRRMSSYFVFTRIDGSRFSSVILLLPNVESSMLYVLAFRLFSTTITMYMSVLKSEDNEEKLFVSFFGL